MDALEILVGTRELLSDPDRHTRNDYARMADGDGCGIMSKDAVKFCAYGGLRRVGWTSPPESFLRAEGYLRAGIHHFHPFCPITSFNDTQPHETVMAAFDRAIELAKADRAAVAAR
jgi:hypothetical protein